MYLKGLGFGSINIVGKVQKIERDTSVIKHGRIIVTKELTYNLYTKKDQIKGIITDYGDSSSHVSILAKQNNLPAIIGTYLKTGKRATDILNNGDIVKLNLKDGTVYKLTEQELVNILKDEF